MAEAGLGWQQILASLTTRPAEHFGEGASRGRLAPGMQADIVAFSGDPSADVTAFADVAFVIRQGRMVYQALD